ncbi:MAG TPA: hypothetical protein VL358_08480 [Caulobacteraceae bacterium]|jgi:hypothetical protein|nr:hypothetical protein [Caulobacteraceae bacterium]
MDDPRQANSFGRIIIGVMVVVGIILVALAIAAAVVGGPVLFKHATPAGSQHPVQPEVTRHTPD